MKNIFPSNWQQFSQWSIQHGKGNNTTAQAFKTVLAKVGYRIWIECNKKIFKEERREVEHLAKEIVVITITISKDKVKNVLNSFQF